MADRRPSARRELGIGALIGIAAAVVGLLPACMALSVLLHIAGGFESVAVILFLGVPFIAGVGIGICGGDRGWLMAGGASAVVYAVWTPLIALGFQFGGGPGQNLFLRVPTVFAAACLGIASASLGGWTGQRLKERPTRVRRWSAAGFIGLLLVYILGRCIVCRFEGRAFSREHAPAMLATVDRHVVALPPNVTWRAPMFLPLDGEVTLFSEPADSAGHLFEIVVDEWALLKGRPQMSGMLWHITDQKRDAPAMPTAEEAAERLARLGVKPHIVAMMRREGRTTETRWWHQALVSGTAVRAGPYPGTLARPSVAVTECDVVIGVGRVGWSPG